MKFSGMSAAMPVLIFLPVFVAIGFLIANDRRGPQPPLTAGQRRGKTHLLLIASGSAIAIAAAGVFIIHRF